METMEEQLYNLRIKRIELECGSLDPEAWQQLASEYEAIGAESNAAACQRRAEHCAAQQWQTYERRCAEVVG